MDNESVISAEQMKEFKIKIHEPFSKFLKATPDEYDFKISLLDVVRFAGHACPSMIGAFLISQKAVAELFPETMTCLRGEVEIEMPSPATQGATGPISNVFSYIFGAWSDSGFGGLQGQFVRRGLLHYSSNGPSQGSYRFRHKKTGRCVDIFYDPQRVAVEIDSHLPFQLQWRHKINAILKNPNQVVWSKVVQ